MSGVHLTDSLPESGTNFLLQELFPKNLPVAAKAGNIEMVRLLLAAGADLAAPSYLVSSVPV